MGSSETSQRCPKQEILARVGGGGGSDLRVEAGKSSNKSAGLITKLAVRRIEQRKSGESLQTRRNGQGSRLDIRIIGSPAGAYLTST